MTHLVHADRGDILVPTPEGPFDPLNWPRAGAYPLFPFHNRLAGAAFTYRGNDYRVKPQAALGGDAMHGPAHRRAWRVESQTADRVELRLDYAADEDWPFSFQASQVFQIAGDGLEIRLALVNCGDRPMPGGIGWHPYFAADVERDGECDAGLAFPLDGLNVPTGGPPSSRAQMSLPNTTGYTIHLAQWRRAWLELDCGMRVEMTADPVFSHFAAHRMGGYMCLEPVSHAAGVFGLPPAKQAEAGLKTLAPGETLSGSIHLRLQESLPKGSS